jgi:hypothetical protein
MSSSDYLMNIATGLFFICYIPEFYANYVNKNANIYNVFEKVILLTATGFGFGYALSIKNKTLVYNYGPLFALDALALCMRGYYAYRNRGHEVRVITEEFDIESNRNPMHHITHTDSDL